MGGIRQHQDPKSLIAVQRGEASVEEGTGGCEDWGRAVWTSADG